MVYPTQLPHIRRKKKEEKKLASSLLHALRGWLKISWTSGGVAHQNWIYTRAANQLALEQFRNTPLPKDVKSPFQKVQHTFRRHEHVSHAPLFPYTASQNPPPSRKAIKSRTSCYKRFLRRRQPVSWNCVTRHAQGSLLPNPIRDGKRNPAVTSQSTLFKQLCVQSIQTN